MKKRVTGIGGIFFKCNDPDKVKAWYSRYLGLDMDPYGTNFEWRSARDPVKKGFTQWSPFSSDSDYFGSEKQMCMINYRVDNLIDLVKILDEEGIEIIGEIEQHSYGRFVHITGPEGERIELWEPNDEEYDKIVEGRTK